MGAFLQDMIEDINFETLPTEWNSYDLKSFSKNKKLWDYQQEAVKNAIQVLWKYFHDLRDTSDEEIQKKKQEFFEWYLNNNLDQKMNIKLNNVKKEVRNLLKEYYPHENEEIPYYHFINRTGFWMATGSGKSLVIIKLIDILSKLIKNRAIPKCDILFLTHRDDLIKQFKNHVEEFNQFNEEKIILKELKEYPEVKRQPNLFGITVFYYRSDNLSDEQKDKIVDFKNYDNDGKWYIFLDEAHKGDREDSKRQHIYSILSRNGFLFNFSATFTDQRDIITTCYEFNLSTFIKKGYGKHISILKQEIRAFKNDEDYNNDEKQKIVLKSLILLTYIKKCHEAVRNVRSDLYHKPLLLVLVNSVNTEDADLKLFFRELERIGKGEAEKENFNKAVQELLEELKEKPKFMFENEGIEIDENLIGTIKIDDILNYVYNSKTAGEIEILTRPSNKKELAFKLKTSDRPFALIKIGDVSEWLKNEFIGYEIQERFEDESFFENLNKEESEINILMGSRGFYEGWDSNRPNVVNFINIGIGEDAKKFILQSVGRGIRIEPIKGKRKRMQQLHNAEEDENLLDEIKDKILPVETLFIFATNRDALDTVIKELEKEKQKDSEQKITLFKNPKSQNYKLLIPTYKLSEKTAISRKDLKFEVSEKDYSLLTEFIDFIQNDRIFLMKYKTEPAKIKYLREAFYNKNNFKFCEKNFGNLDLLVQRFFDYLSIFPEEFQDFKKLEHEIIHFENITVSLSDIKEIQEKINKIKDQFNDPSMAERELKEKYTRGEITLDQYTEDIKKLTQTSKEEIMKYGGKQLTIKNLANHYYIPLILSEDEKIRFINHIIKVESEVKFINELAKYLDSSDNKFKEYDWWMFSKIDENLDQVYIPYYNPETNKISRFFPDFIFWFKKGNNYFILFVDPKGSEHISGWYQKLNNGYKKLFEGREFNYEGLNIRVKLLFFERGNKRNFSSEDYKEYWVESIEEMLDKLKEDNVTASKESSL